MRDPLGGVRNIFPDKADYTGLIKKIPSQKDYVSVRSKRYDKLVRDRIPDMIRSKGKVPVFHIADDEEYKQRLKEKLQEEVEEYLKDNSKDELADILEVLYAICESENLDFSQLELLRKEKHKKRGGFECKIVLENVG